LKTEGLQVTTPTDLEIVMTRSFQAPRALVWQAITRADLVQKWMFTPPGWSWAACEMDGRVGGRFRWAWNGPDGRIALTIEGENKEVVPPERIVHTEHMVMGPGAGDDCAGEGAEPWELLATIELTETAGSTLLTMTLTFPSKQARDGALASGMENGVSAGYDTLDALLPTLQD
jgi:uncharacterized protein YndB with AHSA1/START domain